MQLELAERLRCPRPHAPTPLVVVAGERHDRDLRSGVAGCPTCALEARIVAGDVWFPSATAPSVGAGDPAEAHARDRLLALLDLAEPGGAVLLTGRYATVARALAEAVETHVVALNAAAAGPYTSAVHLAEPAVPFSDGTFRAAALDAELPLPLILDAVRTVAVGGRVLGRLPLDRPATVDELARDAREWVAARVAGGVVHLGRAGARGQSSP